MVPLFLFILIDLVFSAYQTIYSLENGPTSLSVKIAFGSLNFLKVIPIVTAINYASKVTATGSKMDVVVGKVINSCDDEKVLKRVKKI